MLCGGPCTLVQNALPGATVTAPSDGTITQWSIRDASGTFRLVVLQPPASSLQVVASSAPATLTVGDSVSTFPTDLAISAGDYIGLELSPLSEVGLIVQSGASIVQFEVSNGKTFVFEDLDEMLVNATEQPNPPPEPTPPGPTPAATTPPAATAPPAVTAPPATGSVSLDAATINVQSAREAPVKLTCTGTATCSGKLTLTAKSTTGKGKEKHTKAETIATATFSIASGETATIKVTLNGTGRALLSAAHGHLSATLTILKTSPSPSKTQAQSVHLAQQKAKKSKK
jgi:hypothetical protein